MRELIELIEAYERKFNPSNTPAGRRAAHQEVVKKVKEFFAAGKLGLGTVSLRGMYEQLVAKKDLVENITSSAFPVIAGELISAEIIKAYEAYPKFGDKLARTVPSKVKEEKVPGWKAIGTIRAVREREPYGQVTPPDQKYVRIAHEKYGGLLDLTRESIFFDQTGQLVDDARKLGEEGARFREELIMQCVADTLSKSLDLGELYSSGNLNLLTSNPLGTAGWENVHVSLMDKKDDNTGKPIWVMGTRPIMLVPTGLYPTAWKLQQSEKDPENMNNTPNMARNMFDIIVNAYLLKASTTWWYGDFMSQFRWDEVWPLEVFTRVGQDTEAGFNADIIQQFKVSMFGGAGATDTRYVYENQA